MIRQQRKKIDLIKEDREILERLIRRHTEKQSIVMRAKIILMADKGMQHQEIAKKLEATNNTITVWINRWIDLPDKPPKKRLQDSPRLGAPDTFTAEQLCQIIAIACEPPKEHGYPITHWSHRELAEAVIKKEIVDSISVSYIGKMLKKTIFNLIAANIGSTQRLMNARMRESQTSAISTMAALRMPITRSC